eukprot:gene29328-36360_t
MAVEESEYETVVPAKSAAKSTKKGARKTTETDTINSSSSSSSAAKLTSAQLMQKEWTDEAAGKLAKRRGSSSSATSSDETFPQSATTVTESSPPRAKPAKSASKAVKAAVAPAASKIPVPMRRSSGTHGSNTSMASSVNAGSAAGDAPFVTRSNLHYGAHFDHSAHTVNTSSSAAAAPVSQAVAPKITTTSRATAKTSTQLTASSLAAAASSSNSVAPAAQRTVGTANSASSSASIVGNRVTSSSSASTSQQRLVASAVTQQTATTDKSTSNTVNVDDNTNNTRVRNNTKPNYSLLSLLIMILAVLVVYAYKHSSLVTPGGDDQNVNLLQRLYNTPQVYIMTPLQNLNKWKANTLHSATNALYTQSESDLRLLNATLQSLAVSVNFSALSVDQAEVRVRAWERRQSEILVSREQQKERGEIVADSSPPPALYTFCHPTTHTCIAYPDVSTALSSLETEVKDMLIELNEVEIEVVQEEEGILRDLAEIYKIQKREGMVTEGDSGDNTPVVLTMDDIHHFASQMNTSSVLYTTTSEEDLATSSSVEVSSTGEVSSVASAQDVFDDMSSLLDTATGNVENSSETVAKIDEYLEPVADRVQQAVEEVGKIETREAQQVVDRAEQLLSLGVDASNDLEDSGDVVEAPPLAASQQSTVSGGSYKNNIRGVGSASSPSPIGGDAQQASTLRLESAPLPNLRGQKAHLTAAATSSSSAAQTQADTPSVPVDTTVTQSTPLDAETLNTHVHRAFEQSSHLLYEAFDHRERETALLFEESAQLAETMNDMASQMNEEVREVEAEEEVEDDVSTPAASFMSHYFTPTNDEGVLDYAVGPRGGEVYREKHLTSEYYNTSLSIVLPPLPDTDIDQVDSVLSTGKVALKKPLQLLSSAWNKINILGRKYALETTRNILIAYTPPVRDEFYSFSGSEGRVSVKLFAPIAVQQVALVFVLEAHRPLGVSEHNKAAPREVRLTGWTKDPRHSRHQDFQTADSKFDLGTHTFTLPSTQTDNEDESFVYDQAFTVPLTERVRVPAWSSQQHEESGQPLFEDRAIPALRAITVEVLSNHGNEEYTALYRVKVLGELVSEAVV